MGRGELGRRSDIDARVEKDRSDKEARVERGDVQVSDAGHVTAAGEKVELRGTDEGAAEVRGGLEQGLEKVKDVHGDHVEQAETKFEEVKGTEAELRERGKSMESDSGVVKSEASDMQSADTRDARAEAMRAAEAGSQDARYLDAAGDKEKETRETGSRSMKEQAQRIASMRIRGR